LKVYSNLQPKLQKIKLRYKHCGIITDYIIIKLSDCKYVIMSLQLQCIMSIECGCIITTGIKNN